MASKKKNSKAGTHTTDMIYSVGACNKAVHESLLALQNDFPNLFEEMKDHLSKNPFESVPGKYFRLKQYYAWEYRINLYNRVYFQVYPSEGRVHIYSAGAHPKEKVPKPPTPESIVWSKFLKL